MARIATTGSINIDSVFETELHFEIRVAWGGKHFFISLGGKRARQAVATASLGGQITNQEQIRHGA
ncbi:hypothetical protein GW626_03590 [Peribacillus muralis]|uniref:hypothetical protein n=1 Tax=Peribacillus muralis TaxID=264697 RepID=UPI001F4E0445|nr:hypothetical protein [Peribacillus muralis]MCK1993293.1 hypothetical protein [Peribacillus muralis]MCK2013847.1 hypothetical protein [Peribacillus muralis]